MVLILWGGGFGGGGGQRWFVGPLVTLIPLLLSALPTILDLLFGFGTSATYVYDSTTQTWRRQGTPRHHGSPHSGAQGGATVDATGDQGEEGGVDLSTISSVLTGLTSMIITAALTILLLRFVLAVRRNGGGLGAALRRVLFEGFGAGWEAGGQQGQQGRRPVGRTRSERIERVAEVIQSLPVEVYYSRDELERMPVAALKQLLKKRGLECRECLEKQELVGRLAEGGNSTAASCSICFEDYEPGDVLRVLRCGHRFHLMCIDRWLLSSADYSRPPACPMCNRELDGDSDGSSADGGSGGGGGAREAAPGQGPQRRA